MKKTNFIKNDQASEIIPSKLNNTKTNYKPLLGNRKSYPLNEIKLDFAQLIKSLDKKPKSRPTSLSPSRNPIYSKLLPRRQKEPSLSHLSLYLEAKKL